MDQEASSRGQVASRTPRGRGQPRLGDWPGVHVAHGDEQWTLGLQGLDAAYGACGAQDLPDISIDPEEKVLSAINSSEVKRCFCISIPAASLRFKGRQGLLSPGQARREGESFPAIAFVLVLPPRSVLDVCKLLGPGAREVQSLELQSDIVALRPPPPDQPSFVYGFPLEGGPFRCSQGRGGKLTHFAHPSTYHALDFDCPVGTPVLAMSAGIISEIRASETSETASGVDVRNFFQWNQITVKQADGTLAEYVHIKAADPSLKTGDRVREGQVIAQSGDIGFCPTPHLHVEPWPADQKPDDVASTAWLCFILAPLYELAAWDNCKPKIREVEGSPLARALSNVKRAAGILRTSAFAFRAMFDYDELEVKFEERDAKTKTKAPASAAEPAARPSGYAASLDSLGLMPPRIGARKIRVLALHGGGSNTNIMEYQVMPLRRILGDQAEWDFLNGGRDWKFNDGHGVPSIMKTLAAGMPFFGWYGVENDDKTTRTYEEKLFDPSVTFTYKEVDTGVDRVLQRIKERGPVDVILGFSQGCIVSHLVAGLLRERGFKEMELPEKSLHHTHTRTEDRESESKRTRGAALDKFIARGLRNLSLGVTEVLSVTLRSPGLLVAHARIFLKRWYTLGLLLIVAMCLHADQNLAAPNLSAIADEFELSPLEKDSKLGGQVQLGFFFVGGITSLALGPLADRMNRVNLLLLVVILGSVPCALIKYIPSGSNGFLWYLLCRVLTGISVGGSFPLLYSLCGDLCAAEQRGIISAAMGVATSVGVAIGQLLAGFLGPRLGWRTPFVAVAYPAIFFAILLWATVPDPRKRQTTEEGIELSHLSPKASAGSSSSTEAYTAEVELQADAPVSEVYERNPERNPSHGTELKRSASAAASDSDLAAAMDPHAAVTDCSRFGLVWRGRSNRIFLCQAVPGCIAWSTVTTFMPDYLHKEQGLSVESATLLVSFFGASCLVWALSGAALGQRIYNRNKGHLAYLMSCCTAFAVCPFLLLINSSPGALQATSTDGGVGLPSAWALFVAFLGGAAAVTNPNLKGLLMNVNTSATRGTVFALVTLTDDVGKGLGPEVVALGVLALGRRLALSLAMACWLLCALLLYFSRWTIVKDVLRVERLEKLPAAAV
ncbi:unnamed protein product [Symbiodinium natans]|uniref:Major facilitator superfamily (MFS) profile domain-containing protein n=1 Tax=Symbiodinium natans TaxID=878477 RepID=A0A812UDT3_9DINO|nr:unnamed protein product [Symbiodinium natans]